MKIEDLALWDFTEEPYEGCFIRCPDEDCGEISHHENWVESKVGCEICGSHKALMCPKCEECFDHVWSPTFEVYPNQRIHKKKTNPT